MRLKRSCAVGIALAILTLVSCTKESVPDDPSAFPTLRGAYLGQDLPGLIPQLFAPMLAPREDHKHSAPAFSNDGTEVYFSVYEGYDYPQKMKVSRQVDGVWSEPELVPWSGRYQEGGPLFSRDGQRLYFYSKRPQPPDTAQTEESDIWFVERTADGWSDPMNVGAPINSDESGEYAICMSPDDDLVFSRSLANRSQLILAYPLDPATGRGLSDNALEPIPFDGPATPPESFTMGGCYANDGDVLVLHVYSPRGGEQGLMMSHRTEGGGWAELTLMGDMLNRGDSRFPMLSPDEEYFIYTSYLLGPEEIFWVDADIIDTLLTTDLNLSRRLKTTLVNQGNEAARNQLNEFQARYSNYYDFGDWLFDDLGNQFVADSDLTNASVAYRINQDSYPEDFDNFRMFKLAIADGDDSLKQVAMAGLSEESSESGDGVERSINQFGYELLVGRLLEESVEVFELNTTLFPASGNVFDSYAEALLASGDTSASIANYQQSLRLDSTNQNARNVLEQLGVD